jgi:hypothetical protein
MSNQVSKPSQSSEEIAEHPLLQQLGIVRVPADTFEWRGYRYSHAHDAIAAARREKSL